MHVIQFLFYFSAAPDIEVVESSLPKALWFGGLVREGEIKLVSGTASFLSTHGARDALFQNLDYFRGCAGGRLAEQQVDVLGHEDKTYELESVTCPHLAQNLDEQVSGTRGCQEWFSLITTEGDEV